MIFVAAFPFQGFDLQTTMSFQPVIIGVQGGEELLQLLIEFKSLGEEDKIPLCKSLGHAFPDDVTGYDGDQSFAIFYGDIQFIQADFGGDPIRADNGEKAIGFLDAFFDFHHPIDGRRDAFPIHPEVKISFLQFVGEASAKFFIFP
jgi:hypothetical protein